MVRPLLYRFRQVFFAASDLTVDPWNLLPDTISTFCRQEGSCQIITFGHV